MNIRRWSRKLVAVGLGLGCMMMAAAQVQARTVLVSRGSPYHRSPSSLELVLEGGLAQTAGDQDGDFFTTDTGFGAGTGYQLGARLRQHLSPYVAVAPAFQYTRFGTASGVADFGPGLEFSGYEIRTEVFGYGLDFSLFSGRPGNDFRPFVTAGAALMHNRYRDVVETGGVFETSVNAPGYRAGLGFRMRNLELVGEYTYNRFTTNKLDYDGRNLDYNWDFFVVRAGLSFGR